jgi:hypothetical protein
MKTRVIRSRLLAHVAVLAATLAGCNAIVGNDDIQTSDGAVVDGASAGDASSSDVTQHDARATDAPSEVMPSTDSPMTGDSPGDALADTLREADGNDSGDAAPIPEAAVDTGPTCAAPSQICGSVCTDVTSDNGHCGNCMTSCTAPKTCQSGMCACPSRLTDCNGTCVDEQADNSNCGVCGMRCPAGANGTTCIGGKCSCTAGLNDCGGTCVNWSTDNAHCGNCMTTCTGGMTGTNCVGGMCSCGANATSCNGVCSTLTNDNSHCGSCANACAGGSSCAGTTCTCPAGLSFCNGVCVNTATDGSNCGSCSKRCAGVSCTNSQCVARYGNTTLFPGSSNVAANYIFAQLVTVPYAITVTALGNIGVSAGGGVFVMGLYTDSGGVPGSLLVESAPANTVVGAQELPVSARTIAAGTYFVAASVAAGGNRWGLLTTGGTGEWAGTYTYTSTLPANAPSGSGFAGDAFNYYVVGYQ